MSTRATYEFEDERRGKHTVYIHHDGYPTGAAVYFYRMLCMPSNGGMATQFIRANEGAELTGSHDSHGDTEYQYDIEGQGPAAIVTAWTVEWDGDNRSCFFSGRLMDFIEQYKECIDEWGDLKYSPFKQVDFSYSSMWLNEITAKNHIEKEYGCLSTLRSWRERGANTESANWRSLVDDLSKIVGEFRTLMTDEIDSFINNKEKVTQ